VVPARANCPTDSRFAQSTSYHLVMARSLFGLCTAIALVLQAQDTKPEKSAHRLNLEAALSFEAPPQGEMPGGWSGGPPGTISVDDKVVHEGRYSARIERHPDSPSNFSTVTNSIPIEFSGTTIELRGFLRTEGVSDFVGLWMREDGESPGLAFDNMQSRQLKGTTPWTEYSIKLAIHPEATQLVFGVLLAGTGKAWADDLQLLVDGKPVWDAPKVERRRTALDDDHEFDRGSRLSITALTQVQIDNLVMLGKVWGFLKYYHPTVTSGHRHWDYELFRVLPAVLEARDHADAKAALAHWIESLGAVDRCQPCVKLDEADLKFGPDLDWIADTKVLGSELSRTLVWIRDNRVPGEQFYVSKVAGVGNPSFNHEPGYPEIKLPDSGFQLLGLYRFWNIIQYWSPYRDVLGEDWNGTLAEFIPRIAIAKSVESYKQELLALVARAHDGHANLWGSLDVRPPKGKCQLPVSVRFVEGAPAISGFASADPRDIGELKAGDVITELDGVTVTKLIESWKPYYAASNDSAGFRDIGRSMTRGECGETEIGVRRGSQQLKFKVKRLPGAPDLSRYTHDLPGPTFRLLSKDVAYIKLSSIKAADCPHYVQEAAGTKGLIIDIRNYPSEFVVFALGSLLVDKETAFVRFTEGDLSTPGAFHWTAPLSITPQTPHYSGKVVILADETSMSQAEYTTMAFRAAHGATVVGSATSGADGNVSPFALPGDVRTMISGIGVFYPDKTPTQRIGIVPNVAVKPTTAGIRAGRDEVLEEALRQILGGGVLAADIEKMAKP